MLSRIAGQDPSLTVTDGIRQLASLDWTTSQKPAILGYLPRYRSNPYQDLLYSQLPSQGLRAAPFYDVDTAAQFAIELRNPDLNVVMHVHWLNFLTVRAGNEGVARANTKAFLDRLQEIKERGTQLLWTLHNVLPHEGRYPDLDLELRRAMVDIVDRIHIMSPETRQLVAPWYELPEEKTFVVPHPGYDGVYPSWMSREIARSRLGISQSTTVFLLIGAVAPYKGLSELLDAFDELSRSEPGKFMLLVAGSPSGDEETERFCQGVLDHPAALGAFMRIPDDALQVYLRAADVSVFPYRRSLNSGALALATTFGLPCVLPSHCGEAASVDDSYAETYDATNPNGLRQALATAASRLVTSEARAAANAAGERIALPTVARTFAREVRAWLDEY